MSSSPYDQAKRSVEALPVADQLRLVAELVGRLSGQIEHQPHRSLLELRGLGKSVWQDIDVDEYLTQERSSWGG
jgi:RecB family exonuclease